MYWELSSSYFIDLFIFGKDSSSKDKLGRGRAKRHMGNGAGCVLFHKIILLSILTFNFKERILFP